MKKKRVKVKSCINCGRFIKPGMTWGIYNHIICKTCGGKLNAVLGKQEKKAKPPRCSNCGKFIKILFYIKGNLVCGKCHSRYWGFGPGVHRFE